MPQFKGEFTIGDKVNTYDPNFTDHIGRDDLVVLYMDEDTGYGVGPEGNDPDMHHDAEHGWLWYFPGEVTRRDQ
jgi:hypothetical protein